VFLGQGARFTSIRWNRALLPLGGVAVAPGALIFTLDGEFVGIVDVDGGAPAVVGVRDLFDTAAELAAGPQKVAGDLGVSVQPLTPTLAEALHAQGGVVVSDVDPDGPSASVLAQGDVITALDTTTVTGPDQFLLDVARRPIDQAVQVTFLRAGEQQSASVVIKPVTPRVEPVTVSLVRERGVGTRIDRGGEQVIAGLRPGDLVTRAGDIAAPTPAQLQAALAAPSAGDRFVVLIVVRDGRPLVVAVPRSNGDHDVRH
jgi:serine protease Do